MIVTLTQDLPLQAPRLPYLSMLSLDPVAVRPSLSLGV
jgi:hypothetical protein